MNAANNIIGKGAGLSLWKVGIGLVLGLGVSMSALSQPDISESDAPVFEYEERSTIETIPFSSMDEEVLANTVIEGGLAAPAAGVPVQSGKDADFYLDPLALQPRDERTDLGRSEIPVDIRFANPKVVPGQAHSNNYVIRSPQNRSYDALNVNMTERP